MRITRLSTTVLAAMLLAGCVSHVAAEPLSADATVDQILDALDARGKDFHTFTADVTLTETDAALGDATTRTGKVSFQSNNGENGRIRVSFDTLTRDDGRTIKDKLDYLLDGGKFVDRNWSKKSQTTRQVLRPGEKINLLKLGEGPFPLPIGQSRDSVHEQFEATKPEPSKDDPAGTVHLTLVPKPGTRFARQFSSIDVWVDCATNMPTRIGTLDRNKTTDRTTNLTNVRINPELKDSDFVLDKTDLSKWNVVDEPYSDDSGSGR